MKSQKALDAEIDRLICEINYGDDPLISGTHRYTCAFAMLSALRWARGCREEFPHVVVRDTLSLAREPKLGNYIYDYSDTENKGEP